MLLFIPLSYSLDVNHQSNLTTDIITKNETNINLLPKQISNTYPH